MRYVRLFLVVLTGLALLCLGIVAGLYAYATPERLSSRIAAALERDCGLRLTPSAPITVKRLPRLEIRYPRTAVQADAARLSGNVESVVISMHPFAVFAQSPKIDSILIDRPTVSVSAASLDRLFSDNTNPLSITIDKVSVTDGEFQLTEGPVLTKTSAGLSGMPETGASFAVASLVSDPIFSGSLSLSGRTDWRRGVNRLRLEDIRAAAKGLASGRSLELNAECRLIEADAGRVTASDLKTSITESDGVRLTAEMPQLLVGKDGASADNFAFNADFPIGNSRESLRGSASADIGLNGRGIRLSRISAESSRLLPDGTAKASGMISGAFSWNPDDASGELRLEGQYLDTPVMIALTGSRDTSQDNTAAVSGTVQLGDVSSVSNLSLIRIFRRLTAVKADIDISAALLENPVGLTGFRGRLTSSGGRLILTDGTAAAQTGAFPFQAELGSDGRWNISARWEDLQPTSAMPPVFTGRTSGSLNISGRIDDSEQCSFRLRIDAKDGLIYGADLQTVSTVMAEEQPDAFPREAFTEQSSTHFSSLSMTVYGDHGKWTVADGRAEGSGWQASFSGADGKIAADVRFRPSGVRGTFDMPVSLAVSGRSLPVWTPDWQKALSSAVAADGELPMTAGRMKDKLLRELRRWWDEFDPSSMKLPEFNLPEFTLPEFELPGWFPKFGDSGDERPTEADRPV